MFKNIIICFKTEHSELRLDFLHKSLRKAFKNMMTLFHVFKEIREFRKSHQPIIFLNKSYIHSTHIKSTWSVGSLSSYKEKDIFFSVVRPVPHCYTKCQVPLLESQKC